METVRDFVLLIYFLASKVTVDGDCSHEIKRYLLLGKKKKKKKTKIMTNLDSMLKSRDITFPKKGPSSHSYGFPSSQIWM